MMLWQDIERIGGKNGLNCLAELDEAAFRLLAEDAPCFKGTPLSGMPILVKDNIDVKGLHTTAGSLALDDNVAERDAPIIANLRRNGAVILGKTNMTEFANFTSSRMPNGYSSRGGMVIHAADPTLSPGGSSGGSGVAVAAGLVPAAIGTDTSFSVIACAQVNGICGLKPPVGALSAEGIVPIAKTLDSAGVMADKLSDAIRVCSCMRDTPLMPVEAAELSSLRIGVNTARREAVSEGQMRFLTEFLQSAEESGVRITELNQPSSEKLLTIMECEFREQLEEYLRGSDASRKTLREIVAYYESKPETMMKYGIDRLQKALETDTGSRAYKEAMAERDTLRKKLLRELGELDAVILTGPSNIMHFCGLPSVCVSSAVKNDYGVNRCLILYGADEPRLYRAALSIEKQLKRSI